MNRNPEGFSSDTNRAAPDLTTLSFVEFNRVEHRYFGAYGLNKRGG